MSNYRQFSPYRQTYRSGNRMSRIVGWSVAAVVVVLLAKNVFLGGDKNDDANKNSEVSLVSNGNANSAVPAADEEVSGRELTTRDCPKAISRASVDVSVVSITLDGGGIPGDAARALEAFKAKQVAPTLFVTGKWAEENRDLVKAFHDAGSDVYNHSYSHPTLTDIKADAITADLAKADAAIKEITSVDTKPFFRPPFGTYNAASLTAVRDAGYCTVLWTVDAYDWKTDITVDQAKTRVLDNLKQGAIIVLQANSDVVVDLIGPLVDEIRGKGYTIVPLHVLLRQQGDPPAEEVTAPVNANANTSVNKNVNANKKTNTNTTRSNTNTGNVNKNS